MYNILYMLYNNFVYSLIFCNGHTKIYVCKKVLNDKSSTHICASSDIDF